jgi:hypothetical protein
MFMPIQKESVVTSEEEAKGISIEVIYFIILLALPFTFAAISLLLLAILGPVQVPHCFCSHEYTMKSVAINTLDKTRNFTVRAGGGAACVCDQTPTVIYTYSSHIVTRGTFRLKDWKDIAFIIFKVLTARSALITITYEPYPETRGPMFMKCLESLFSLT